jgi:hypothetical protein
MKKWNVWYKDQILDTLLMSKDMTAYEVWLELPKLKFPKGAWVMEY